MKDAQIIFGLFIILVIILSMGLQFRRKEGFSKYTTTNATNIGSKLNYKPITKIKGGSKNGAERYLGLGYLGIANAPNSIATKNIFDGMPSHY